MGKILEKLNQEEEKKKDDNDSIGANQFDMI
jgi:hypothetical protein